MIEETLAGISRERPGCAGASSGREIDTNDRPLVPTRKWAVDALVTIVDLDVLRRSWWLRRWRTGRHPCSAGRISATSWRGLIGAMFGRHGAVPGVLLGLIILALL